VILPFRRCPGGRRGLAPNPEDSPRSNLAGAGRPQVGRRHRYVGLTSVWSQAWPDRLQLPLHELSPSRAGHCGALPAAAGGGRRQPATPNDMALAMAAEVAAVHSSNELLAMVEHHWPNSGWVPEPARPGNGGGSAAPAGPGPTGHATRLSAWSSTTANRTGPLATRRQRPRRRITPNTNTSTTTMISTHNHVDMAASFGRRRPVRGDATAAHPSKQLDHSQATSWARIDGRATPGPTGPSAPRDLPADLDWPGEGQPGSRPRARLGPSPRAMPSRPALPPHLAPTTGGPGQASPTRRDHREPDRAGDDEAEKSLPCLGAGTMRAGLC
jgi:hypothetical protein